MLKKLIRPVVSAAIAVAAGILVPGVSGAGAGLLDVGALFGSAATTVELMAAGEPTELWSAYRLRVAELPEPPADVTYAPALGEGPIMAPLGCPFEVRAIIAGGGDAFAIVAEARVGVGSDEDSAETRLVRTGDTVEIIGNIATARGRATITAITKRAVELELNAAAIRCEFNTR